MTLADNYFGTYCFVTVTCFRRRGSQLPAGLQQYNMILSRQMPGRFAAAHDVWPSPGSGRNKRVCRKCAALTRKGSPFVWTDRRQEAFEALKACLVSAPILGFPTESGRFVLDTDASLFALAGVLSQLQNDREVMITYASRSLRLSQRRYCTIRREMLAAVVMCTHFRPYLRGAQFILHTDHSSLRWLQRFRNEDGLLARWYLLLGQFFSYIRVPSRGTARECRWDVPPMRPVSAACLSGVGDGFADSER